MNAISEHEKKDDRAGARKEALDKFKGAGSR